MEPSVCVNLVESFAINLFIKNTSMKTKGMLDTCGDVLLTFTTSLSKGLSITLQQLQAAQEAVMDGGSTTVNQPQ